jgi:hypothetical protein
VGEQFGGDGPLARREDEEAVQPGREHRPGRLPLDRLGGRADGVDLVLVEGLQELQPAGEVAVERGHADARAPGDLGHGDVVAGAGERLPGHREDLLAVALGVCTSGG